MSVNPNEMTVKEFRRYCIENDTEIEGGLTKGETLKNDLGGLTNHGITEGKAREYKTQLGTLFGWDGTMENLSKDMAFYIYEYDFWHGMRLDDICEFSRRLANAMFRWGLKSGQSRPGKQIQMMLNTLNNQQKHYPDLVVDGLIGSKTMSALNALKAKRGHVPAKVVLYCGMQSAMETHMFNISDAREKNQTFTWGWVTRCINERSQYIEEYGAPEL